MFLTSVVLGYLTYQELRTAINTLETPLTQDQITRVIESVDQERDGRIELSELVQATLPVEQGHMGVKSSPWKFYVDPAQVQCSIVQYSAP